MDTIEGYLFEQSMINNFIIRYFPKISWENKYAEELLSALNSMKNVWREVVGKKTLTVCYFQCPHVGFVFDRMGNFVPEQDKLDWTKKELYLGQLIHLNRWIEETVELIQENDPGAVIVMQSDHGVRYAKHCMFLYEEEEYDAKAETEYMQNILNCVYLGDREQVDIAGLSGINTWRTVLNTLLGSDYEMLPEPEGYVYEWRKVNGIQ